MQEIQGKHRVVSDEITGLLPTQCVCHDGVASWCHNGSCVTMGAVSQWELCHYGTKYG